MQSNLEFNQRDLGHGASETVLHPVVMVALLVTCVIVLVRPRKDVIFALLVFSFLVPRGQEIYFLAQHWYALRIVLLTGFVRLAKERFRLSGGLNSVDKLFILWALYRAVAIMLTNWPNGAGEQTALCVQAFAGYFLLRYLIQGEDDIVQAAKALAVSAVILAPCMLIEHFRGVNVFGYLGGAPLFPEVRNGSIRAQATFGHSILAGCFAATLVPLFFWLWKSGRARVLGLAGAVGSTTMMLTSNSSTPALAWAAGVGALFLWPIRGSMRLVRWGIVLALLSLALVMKAPVWFIVAHVDVVGGSGGYDRAVLIDVFVRHFKDWWLIGTNQNGNWGYDMWDLSNQFVAEGEMGGLVTFVCFIAMISLSFGKLGRMRRLVSRNQQWLLWSLGAVMLANIFAYFGVAYWDQTQVWWFAFLAMISAATVGLQNPQSLGLSTIARNTHAMDDVVAEPVADGEWSWSGAGSTNKGWSVLASRETRDNRED